MTQPEANAIYLIELCSGERRRWRCLAQRPGDAIRWWRDLESGREFNEASLMYAWRILSKEDDPLPQRTEVPMSDSTQPDIDRLIIEQMADALIYSDSQGIIRQWNAAAEALFGYPRDQAIGQSLDLIIPERLRAAHWSGFHRAMAQGTTRLHGRATVTRGLTKDGKSIYVEMSFAVVTGQTAKAIGSVAVARDATQRHLDESALRARLAALAGDA